MGKSPMNVVVLLGVGEGQAGMAGTDRAPVLLLPDRRFVPTVRALRSRDTRYPPIWAPTWPLAWPPVPCQIEVDLCAAALRYLG
jgi:hypothetical protein